MTRLPIFFALLALAGAVSAQDAADASGCPQLPSGSNLAWKKTDGADFVVCRAMRGDTQVFGMYFGNHPSYLHRDQDKAETSMVAGHEVTWYNASPGDKQGAFARDALIRLGKEDSDGVVHVWISASDETEFKAALTALEGVTLKDNAPATATVPAPAEGVTAAETAPVEAPASEEPSSKEH